MLFTPLWKRALIFIIVILGFVYAAPNFLYSRAEARNDAAKELAKTGFATEEQQAAIDAWPAFLPTSIMNLGLDLRGGAHLLAEVNVTEVYAQRMKALWPEVREALGEKRDVVGSVRRQPSVPDELRVSISRPEGMAEAIAAIQALTRPVISLTGGGADDLSVTAEADEIVIRLSEAEIAATDTRTMEQSLEIIRRRVDEAGTREPTIQRQGVDRILIQVPGVGSAQELKDIIGRTARLTFQQVLNVTSDAGADPGARNQLVPDANDPARFYILNEEEVVSGEDLTNAQPAFDQNGQPAVNFSFDTNGARRFGDYTAEHIGEPFAIVLDGEVISAPTIQSHIAGGSGIITGNFTVEETTKLAILLRAGSLPATMQFLEERTIGPELGQDSIDAGVNAAIFGGVLVLVYMIASYGIFGLFANIALLINIALLVAAMSGIGATLTLPGIAGIVLTMGIAVDANVLIFERMREELRDGSSPVKAIDEGFNRAFSAIMDSNVTAIITGVIMFAVGSGAIRGFAVTLIIGIVTSMFTAVYVTRQIIELWMNWRRPNSITV